MSDFENFLCFSSAMAMCRGTGNAEARGGESGGESKRKIQRRRKEKKERISFLSPSPRAPPPQSSLFCLRTSHSSTPRHRRGKTKKIFKIAHII